MSIKANSRVVLNSRPGVSGKPVLDNFALEECEYPTLPNDEGFVIVKTTYLSVDPYMRCRMNEDSGVHYMKSWNVGDVITGSGLGVVVESNSDKYRQGAIVYNSEFHFPWQKFSCLPDSVLTEVNEYITADKHSLVLGALGVSGITSWIGLKVMSDIDKNPDKVLVVSAAAGSCGSLACQIAKLWGCKQIIGIAGSKGKCDYLKEDLKIQGTICYKSENVASSLQRLCPNGIDVYFDNVGGEISDEVIKQMNTDGQIILCGQISVYNKDLPYPPPIDQKIEDILTNKRISRERFLVINYPNLFKDAVKDLMRLVLEGKLKTPETIAKGLEYAGSAFVSMMEGGNIGKQIVQI